MSEDIVDRLTAWVEREMQEPDPASAILDARDAIIAARKATMELSAGVIGAESLAEARAHAWRLAPLTHRAVLVQGFHEVEAMWRTAIGKEQERLQLREVVAGDIADAFTKARWIPVGERLPEEGGRFLVVVNSDDNPYTDAANWWRGDWWTGHSPAQKHACQITHWMPLPEPPALATKGNTNA